MARNAKQVDLNLQRGVRQLAHDLRFSDDFGGHEVKQQHAQRTNILMHRTMLRHDEDILPLQNRGSRQGIGNSNGHGMLLTYMGKRTSRSLNRLPL